MLAREKIIADSESSIAVFLVKWFGGKIRLNCGDRAVSCTDETTRLMPESKAPSIVPKAFFSGSDPDSRELSKEEQAQLVIVWNTDYLFL